MRKEYDFSKSIKNPYAKKVKKQISIKIEVETIEYFCTLPYIHTTKKDNFDKSRQESF